MREIKFRAWKDYSCRFEYITLEDALLSTDDDLTRIKQSGFSKFEQFTGLLDKNGKEIYEGDILLITQTDWASMDANDSRTLDEYLDSIGEQYVVDFSANYYGACFTAMQGEYEHNISCGTHGRITVIGNIHESPELLEA